MCHLYKYNLWFIVINVHAQNTRDVFWSDELTLISDNVGLYCYGLSMSKLASIDMYNGMRMCLPVKCVCLSVCVYD